MTDLNPRVVEGNNMPPSDPLKTRTEELVKAANQWAGTEISDQDNADALSAFVDQLRAAEKDVEKRRKDEKKPHDDAAKAVDAEWNPLKDLLAKAKGAVSPRLTAWLQKLEQDRQEKIRRDREEADRLAKAAADAAAKAAAEASASGDVIGSSVAADAAAKAAEEAQKLLAKAEKAPVNMQSSLGARTKSLRTYWHGRVTSHMQALAFFKSHPKVIALIEELAEQAAGKDAEPVPGVEFYSEQRAA